MPPSLRLRRLLWLVPLGLLLSGIVGYIGAIVLEQAIAVWMALMFLKLVSMQFGDFFKVLAGPALYGLMFTWPVNAVLLPLVSLWVGGTSNRTPFLFLALAAIAGGAWVYICVATGLIGFKPEDAPWFGLAGAAACAVSGLVFGLVLRRHSRNS